MDDKNNQNENTYEPSEQIKITQATNEPGTGQRRALRDVQESDLTDTTKPNDLEMRQNAPILRQNEDYDGPTLEDLRKLALEPTKKQKLVNKAKSTIAKVKQFSTDHELGTKASIGASYGLNGAMATANGAGTVLGFIWRHISGSYWKFRLNGAMSRRYHSDDSLTPEEKETKRRLNYIKFGIGFLYLILLRYAWPLLLFALLINAIWSNFRYYWYSTNDPMIQLVSAVADDFHKGAYSPRYYYYELPIRLYDYGEELESFLSSGASGPRSANIVGDPFVHLNTRNVPNAWSYADLTINNLLKHNPVRSINQDELLNLSLLPMTAGVNGSWYWELGGKVRINLNALLNGESYDETIEKIASNEALAGQFRELAGDIERRKQEEADRLAKAKEAEELERYRATVAEAGLPASVATMLATIRKNKDSWGFVPWNNGNSGLRGNDHYFVAKMLVLSGNSLNSIKSKLPLIKTALRHTVMLDQGKDKGSFFLKVLMEDELNVFDMSVNRLKEFGANNQIYFGKSYTGDLKSEWSNQAQHLGVWARSGAGKTYVMMQLLANMIYLKDFNYRNVIITSGEKVGDFAPFQEAGAYVGKGLPNILRAVRAVNAEARRRETLFEQEHVPNMWSYNKKVGEDKQLDRIILVVDEIENALNDPDKKASAELQTLLSAGLNIYRSDGITLFAAGQTPLKSRVGNLLDKLTISVVGNNQEDVLNHVGVEIKDYFRDLKKAVVGVFFATATNLKFDEDTVTFGSTNYTLIQTPNMPIKAKDLPHLTGAEFMKNADTTGQTEPTEQSTVGGSIDDFL